jgi:putrescine transport system substrate-binding protein
MLAKVRPHIRLFSSTMIDDLAGGKACVALGWAGDMNIAKARAIENKNGNDIQVLLPSTGGLIFMDNLAIPKDAKHPNNAMAFINYFLKPEVSASLTNELSYPTANKASLANVTPEIAADKTVFRRCRQHEEDGLAGQLQQRSARVDEQRLHRSSKKASDVLLISGKR